MMRGLRYAVALVVVVDFLVAVVQMQQAVIERASFVRPSVTTFGQFAVTLTAQTPDDLDLYVRDPAGDLAWYGVPQRGPLSLEHDMIPGKTDPVRAGVHELTVVREAAPGEYVANVDLYSGSRTSRATVELWDLRGWRKRLLIRRVLAVGSDRPEQTAFRWRLAAGGRLVGHDTLQTDLLRDAKAQ